MIIVILTGVFPVNTHSSHIKSPTTITMTDKEPADFTFIVIGGGIAGVTCVEALASLSAEYSILLISASPIVKAIVNFKQLTQAIEEFDVREQPSSKLSEKISNLTVLNQMVARLDNINKEVVTTDGCRFRYRKLCICTGARPKIIAEDNPFVLGIRDTETIHTFQSKLLNARQIVVVGNGGIATELVYSIKVCDIVWAIKDESIVSTFVDAGAAKFLLSHLGDDKPPDSGPVKRHKYHVQTEAADVDGGDAKRPGASLGPDWMDILNVSSAKQTVNSVHVEYKVEVKLLLSPLELKELKLLVEVLPGKSHDDWPIYVQLSNDKVYGCDFVVSATGLIPNTRSLLEGNNFDVSDDGGLNVNVFMQTTVSDVFAAGDVCHANWEKSAHWHQMRLWTQARQMGNYSAKCMMADVAGELHDTQMDFCFELFAHCTRFFNYKVIVLGQFNGQTLGDDYYILARVKEGEHYVKVLLRDGRMRGAVLIGETDLEETFENLILNELDLSRYGEDLLEQDIEDFFD